MASPKREIGLHRCVRDIPQGLLGIVDLVLGDLETPGFHHGLGLVAPHSRGLACVGVDRNSLLGVAIELTLDASEGLLPVADVGRGEGRLHPRPRVVVPSPPSTTPVWVTQSASSSGNVPSDSSDGATCQAEVGDTRAPIPAHHDIARLEIAMGQTPGIGLGQPLPRPNEHLEDRLGLLSASEPSIERHPSIELGIEGRVDDPMGALPELLEHGEPTDPRRGRLHLGEATQQVGADDRPRDGIRDAVSRRSGAHMST